VLRARDKSVQRGVQVIISNIRAIPLVPVHLHTAAMSYRLHHRGYSHVPPVFRRVFDNRKRSSLADCFYSVFIDAWRNVWLVFHNRFVFTRATEERDFTEIRRENRAGTRRSSTDGKFTGNILIRFWTSSLEFSLNAIITRCPRSLDETREASIAMSGITAATVHPLFVPLAISCSR
jgi:hypothetical protein